MPIQDLAQQIEVYEVLNSDIPHGNYSACYYIGNFLPPCTCPSHLKTHIHFCRYLHTHVLITGVHFLLLIDVPIQNLAQQIEVYEVFNLDIPHGNYSACYYIGNKYLGITLDETSAIEISEDQFQACQKANGQFCILNTPLLPLANAPTCVSALYTKDKDGIQKRCSLQVMKVNIISIPTSIAPNVWIITSTPAAGPSRITLICPGETPRTIAPQTPIHILCLQPACSATSHHSHLLPCYESHDVIINISLNIANLNVVNISAPRRSLEWDLTSSLGQYSFSTH